MYTVCVPKYTYVQCYMSYIKNIVLRSLVRVVVCTIYRHWKEMLFLTNRFRLMANWAWSPVGVESPGWTLMFGITLT